MSCRPPEPLLESLTRLELISAAQWRAAGVLVGRRARGRAGRELARYESAWLDALVQLRALTPYQAAALRAGRGESLRVGPHVIHERLSWSRRAATYRARGTGSGRWRLLAVFPSGASARTTAAHTATATAAHTAVPRGAHSAAEGGTARLFENLERLAQWHRRVEHPGLALVGEYGRDGPTIWAAARWVEGRSLAEWLARRGRFPADSVEDIVRQAAAALAALHHAGCCHGDLDPTNIVLGRSGEVTLVLPGLHTVAPAETTAPDADWAAESSWTTTFDSVIAPSPPTPADDLVALGRVAWVAMTGRPTRFGAGGPAPPGTFDRGAAAGAVGTGPFADVARLRGALSEGLSTLLFAAVEPRPRAGAMSAAELAARLGAGWFDQRRALIAALAESGAGRSAAPQWLTRLRGVAIAPRWLAGVLIGLAATVLLGWWLTHRGDSVPATPVVPRTVSSGHAATSTGPIVVHPPSGAAASNANTTASGAPGGAATDGPSRSPTPPVAGSTSPAARSDSAPTAPGTGGSALADGSDEVILGANEPLAAASLPIRGGRTLRGAAGARPTVVVDRSLVVDAGDVRFVDLDFVWRGADVPSEPRTAAAAREPPEPSPPSGTDADEGAIASMIRLRAAAATFERCTFSVFRAEGSADIPRRATPAAIGWENALGRPADPLSLPGGRLRLAGCVLHGLGGGIRCRRDGARRIELDNVLAVDSGALVRLDRAAAADEPTHVRLARVTLRGGGPLLECRHDELPEVPGRIAVETDACAFAPAPETALVSFRGQDDPSRWIERIEWLGADSFLAIESPMIDWHAPDAPPQRLDDAAIRVAGLVRCALGFAGAAGESVAASAVARWQGPTRSTRPPGAEVDSLPPLPAHRRAASRAQRHDTTGPSPPGGA